MNKTTNLHIHGFIATVAIVVLAIGSLGFMLVTSVTAFGYADSVYRKEMRIQKKLNMMACLSSYELIKQKNYFLNTNVYFPEFQCTIKYEL